jgi:ketosteroid isomerase-like protein
MSEKNLETFQRATEAWDADNLDAWLAELDPEAEWHAAIEQAFTGRRTTYRGHDGLRKAWDEFRNEAWGGFRVLVQEIRDLGESVLVLGRLVTARTAGIEAGQEFGQLVTFRDGKILRSEDFLSHAEALEAAGLRE